MGDDEVEQKGFEDYDRREAKRKERLKKKNERSQRVLPGKSAKVYALGEEYDDDDDLLPGCCRKLCQGMAKMFGGAPETVDKGTQVGSVDLNEPLLDGTAVGAAVGAAAPSALTMMLMGDALAPPPFEDDDDESEEPPPSSAFGMVVSGAEKEGGVENDAPMTDEQAATKVQTRYRYWKQKRDKQAAKIRAQEERAAIIIQSRYRARHGRKRMDRKRQEEADRAARERQEELDKSATERAAKNLEGSLARSASIPHETRSTDQREERKKKREKRQLELKKLGETRQNQIQTAAEEQEANKSFRRKPKKMGNDKFLLPQSHYARPVPDSSERKNNRLFQSEDAGTEAEAQAAVAPPPTQSATQRRKGKFLSKFGGGKKSM